MSKTLAKVISLALHACALALHSKACVGVAMALPPDTRITFYVARDDTQISHISRLMYASTINEFRQE